MKGKSLKTTLALSRLVSGSLALQLALAPLAMGGVDSVLNQNPNTISAGQTAGNKPPVDDICETLKNAASGNFTADNGKPLQVLDPACATKYTFKSQQREKCMKDLDKVVGETKGNLDAICAGTTTGSLASYCAMRAIAKNSQAISYCKAYESADKAQAGVSRTLYFDVAAAGTCWAEYIAMKVAASNGVVYKGFACGGAAMAASLMELWQTASVLKKQKNSYDDSKTPGHSGGSFVIDDSNNVHGRADLMKALEITASTGLSASAFAMGMCYYNKDKNKGLCKTFASMAGGNSKNAQKIQDGASKRFYKEGGKTYIGYDEDIGMVRVDVADNQKAKDAFNTANDANGANQAAAQMNLAMQTAIVFTSLAAMRGVAYSSANKTKGKVTDLLQSMFGNNQNGSGVTGNLGGTPVTAFIGPGGSSYQSGSGDGTKTSGATAAAGPSEAFLVPPGSALNAKATEVASRMPPSLLSSAGNSGSDFAKAITGATQAAGGSNPGMLADIQSRSASIFANLPPAEGGYSSGGAGGGKLADGGKGSDGDLNLKSLFGQNGGGEDHPIGDSGEVAFRGPAAEEDIWHSQNPKGNNLFQIVSDRYDTMQRRVGMGAGL
jgi:hypothetical protein